MLPSNDPFPVGRRIKAAMRLADIESIEELAQRIDTQNLGARTLRKIADDRDTSRTANRLDLVAIADATGLPYEFFTVPGDELVSALAGRGDGDLGERVTRLEESLSSLRMELARTAIVRAAREVESSEQRTEGPRGADQSPGSEGGPRR